MFVIVDARTGRDLGLPAYLDRREAAAVAAMMGAVVATVGAR